MPTKIKHDLRPYIESINAFRRELMTNAEAKKPLSISRVFQLLPIKIITEGGRASLESRGNGVFEYERRADGSVAYKNKSLRSMDDEIIFRDDCLGLIEAHIPTVLTFVYKPNGEDIELLSADQHVVVNSIERLVQLPKEVVEKLFPLRLDSFFISPARMMTTFKDSQNALFVIDGLLPIGLSASVKDYICATWQVWSYRNEYMTETHCKIQRSYTPMPTDAATMEYESAEEKDAREWAEKNSVVCPVID